MFQMSKYLRGFHHRSSQFIATKILSEMKTTQKAVKRKFSKELLSLYKTITKVIIYHVLMKGEPIFKYRAFGNEEINLKTNMRRFFPLKCRESLLNGNCRKNDNQVVIVKRLVTASFLLLSHCIMHRNEYTRTAISFSYSFNRECPRLPQLRRPPAGTELVLLYVMNGG